MQYTANNSLMTHHVFFLILFASLIVSICYMIGTLQFIMS